MKIHEEYSAYKLNDISIRSAEYLKDYLVKLVFDDGVERTINFMPFLLKAQHPHIKKYLDKTLFSKFDIVNGNLNWNDYQLIFPVNQLYKGQIKF